MITLFEAGLQKQGSLRTALNGLGHFRHLLSSSYNKKLAEGAVTLMRNGVKTTTLTPDTIAKALRGASKFKTPPVNTPYYNMPGWGGAWSSNLKPRVMPSELARKTPYFDFGPVGGTAFKSPSLPAGVSIT